MKKSNYLVLGSGGREHAIIKALAQSKTVGELYCIPGNGGISQIAKTDSISLDNFEELAEFAKNRDIHTTIVGPEVPLVEGIVDYFKSKNLKIFGPDKIAAQLEGSKAYSKAFMKKYDIPTAGYHTVTQFDDAKHILESSSYPIVLKASGLAAGKGVIIAENLENALSSAKNILIDKHFGDAGNELVIESFLEGTEISVFIITDGTSYHILPTAQDHKRAFDGDLGPNTGGMGAYAPANILSESDMQHIQKTIINPTLTGIKNEGGHYTGILYFGLMIADETPFVLEYNCRFGDPEAQVILPLIETDLDKLIEAALNHELDKTSIKFKDEHAVTVILASGGYPGSYKTNLPISFDHDDSKTNIIVYHSGTKRTGNSYFTTGGRVLAVTALGSSVKSAVSSAYDTINDIHFKDSFYRTDIASKALNKE